MITHGVVTCLLVEDSNYLGFESSVNSYDGRLILTFQLVRLRAICQCLAGPGGIR